MKSLAGPNKSTDAQAFATVDVRWLVAGRLCLLSIVLLGANIDRIFFSFEASNRMLHISQALAAFFIFSAISAWWVRTRTPSANFILTQLCADQLLITAVIYVTGGPVSPFLFLYLPLVMAAALLLSRAAALTLAAMTVCLYALLSWGLIAGYIPPGDPAIAAVAPTGGLLLQLLGLLCGMVLIAVATSFLKRQLASTYELAALSQQTLSHRDTEQRALINGLQDGVITVSQHGSITLVNKAASELLQIEPESVLGKKLDQLFKDLDPKSELAQIAVGTAFSAREATLMVKGRSLKLNCQGNVILDSHGSATGSIFVFQDVTNLRSIEEQLRMQERLAQLLSAKDDDRPVTQTKVANFVGESPVMHKVFNLIGRVAQSEATVLISGESGTGKELVAKAIHLGSNRARSPFVAINCGAIPENLIESELFGHKKGAFTSADSDAPGLFRSAEGGTVFLDEIGELPLLMQTKLLRALQEKKVRPVGSDRDIPTNVRVIAATNRNLRREIERSNFREDLYYRLNVVNIALPPLRDRKEDIPLLVNSILRSLCKDRKPPIVPPATMGYLLDFQYPGNVRELENILERALVLGGEAILPEHLPEIVREPRLGAPPSFSTTIIVDESISLPINLDSVLASLERRYLEAALIKTKGAKKKAAEMLGMNFRSFRYRLQKFGLGDESEQSNTDS
jgi:PAS domain S-box-containing protein